MKNFRHIALSALLTLGSFAAITYTACNKDACKDVTCNNGGTCSGGNCTCPSGYSGNNCETLWSTPFVGTWTATEGSGTSPYQVIITANPTDPTKLLISNLGNYGCTTGGNITFDGTLSTSLVFSINENECSTQMNATGTYNANNGTISIPYTAIYGGVTDNYTAVLSK